MRKVHGIVLAIVPLVLFATWAFPLPDAAAAVEHTGTANRAPATTTLDPDTPLASDGSTVVAPSSRRAGIDGYRGTGTGRTPTVVSPDGKTDPGGQRIVIGTDDRTLITDTTAFPYRAIVRISFSRGSCTGWMIGENTLATAGHCVGPGGNGDFYDPASYTVAPGQNGGTQPYGTCGATKLFSVAGWLNSGDEHYDYGAIKLNCAVGTATGWFGFFWQSSSLTGNPATGTGYPNDKPFGTIWTHTLTIAATEKRQLFYEIDTGGGQSGSPVWKPDQPGLCDNSCAMAIHAYGRHGTIAPHSNNNHGTRITEAGFHNLIGWRDAPK